MPRTRLAVLLLVALFTPTLAPAADAPSPRTPREALQAFNDLIGSWRCTGTPEGTREEKQRGFWTETMQWQWQFKGKDTWLKVDIARGKYFTKGELRYLPEKDAFQLTLVTPAKESLTLVGPFKDHRLVLEREDSKKKETQRLLISFLHSNRFLYRWETKPADQPLFTRHYQVGATKEGEPFAQGETGPECVVSGGLGTIKVMYKGQTYFVCCTGCRDAFLDDPEMFLKEYQARKAKKEKPAKP